MNAPTDRPPVDDVPGASWSGRLAFGPWWLLYSGPVGRTDEHAHHAFQIVVHAGGPLLSDGERHLCPGPIVMFRPNVVHAFRDEREHVLVIYIDPESSAGLSLGRSGAPSAPSASSHPVVDILGGFRPHSWPQAEQAVHRTVRALSPQVAPPPAVGQRHPAVERALQLLPEIVADGVADVGLLAEQLGLSSSRLTHLFTAQVGVPLRSYARWLRLIAATEELAGGSTITQAAHRTGFSDAGHFSRTFHSMFGLAPSEAVGLGTWLVP